MSARLQGIAWAHQRPGKKPADLKNEQWWRQELTDAGYDVVGQASNGEEALALIRQGLGQVMLLDLTMPVLDGYQTLAALRAEGLKSQVIVVSGDVQEEAVRRVRELGALAFSGHGAGA